MIKKGVEKYSSLDDYVNALMVRFDTNNDGLISIEELGVGLKSINVKISEKEKLALMKELDLDRDGGLTKQELYKALAENGRTDSTVSKGFNGNTSQTNIISNPAGVDQILLKIKNTVAHLNSKEEQLISLLKIFDQDNDGLITYLELVAGVKQLGISANRNDMMNLMNRIDADKDGFITQNELYKSLNLKASHKGYQGSTASINEVLTKLRQGGEKYASMTDYVNYIYKLFAKAGSNYMTFDELVNCLKTFNFNLIQVEKIAFMKKIDSNGDNKISKEEFMAALNSVNSQSPRKQQIDPEDFKAQQGLMKIKAGASSFKNLADYCMALMRKLDTNKDGFISSSELVEGLRVMGIKITKGQMSAMMRRIDEDRDGSICYDELYRALNSIN